MQLVFCVFLIVLASSAHAQQETTSFHPAEASFETAVMPSEEVVSETEPVLLTADKVQYLQQDDVVMATGKVEVVQKQTVLLADELIYDRKRNIVTARGNVSVMDSTGSVMFSDEVELRDDLAHGVIDEFRMRLNDNSLFAAERATRVNENVLVMDKAVYSPCKVKCVDELEPGEEPKAPLWQMRANQVTVDQEKQTIVYDDAQMELYGVPVFYTPYLSHATPNADSKSGVMVPEFRRDQALGNVYTLPLFWAIAPDRDAVVTPVETSKEGMLLKGTYRQAFDEGRWHTEASITNPRSRDVAGNLIDGHDVRGHIYSIGEFDVDDDTRWGFDIKRTTDDTYLRRYDIDGQTLLVSKVYGETYDFMDSDRSALTAETIAFQGLAAGDNPDQIPFILPLVNFDYESDPLAYGSRYFIDSNAMVLSRDMGAKSNRLSNTLGWRLPYITSDGQVLELTTKVRGDIYEVSDVLLPDGRSFDGTTGRLVPEASLMWRYPFISLMSKTSVMVEPVVNFAVSPNGGNPETIPNEDSLVPEFTDTNLFSTNRFAGYDRIEHGPRVSYGLRGLVNYQLAYIDWLVGQHYRVEEDRNFPFSNDLEDHLSDYVGKVGLQINPFYLAYRFRLDKETFTQRRKELDLSYAGKRITLNAAYLALQNDPVFASREEVVGAASVNITRNWLVGGGIRHDIQAGQITNLGAEITFKNECVNVQNVITREYTRDRELKPNTSYVVRVSLKNLN